MKSPGSEADPSRDCARLWTVTVTVTVTVKDRAMCPNPRRARVIPRNGLSRAKSREVTRDLLFILAPDS